jgi:hypothetical protein
MFERIRDGGAEARRVAQLVVSEGSHTGIFSRMVVTDVQRNLLVVRPPDVQDGEGATTLSSRIRTRITQAWHTCAMRLAGRIWGEYKRRINPFARIAKEPSDIWMPDALVVLIHFVLLTAHAVCLRCFARFDEPARLLM